jgi:uncharacterized protein
MPGPPPLPGVDRSAFAVALATRLRRAGVPVSLTGAERLTQALGAHPPESLGRLYWAARISLVCRPAEIAVFDAVFDAVFRDAGPVLPRGRSAVPPGPAGPQDALLAVARANRPDAEAEGLPWLTLPPAVAAAEPSGDESVLLPQRLPSDLEGLADLPFAELDAGQMALLGRWLERAVAGWPTRRTRRHCPHKSGRRIAVRPTVARARRTGWEAVHLVRVHPVEKPRRVVMLCDVSQSMQQQAAAYLHLMRALALVAGAEAFAFATRLTRLTATLAHRSPALAIEEATRAVADRFGGTRIASCLSGLLSSYHGNLLRGAVVIIGSDGWDSDSPDHLAAAMARLRRRAYRVIWANPRAAAPGFEPRVAAMAAALPYCDALLPADTFRSLTRVIEEISASAVERPVPVRPGPG